MDNLSAIQVEDKVFHDSACLLTHERWDELVQALQVVMPDSSLVPVQEE